MIKQYIQVSTGDLAFLYGKLMNFYASQHHNISTKRAQQAAKPVPYRSHELFIQIGHYVSESCLKLIWAQYTLLEPKIKDEKKHKCTGITKSSQGIPCKGDLHQLRVAQKPLTLDLIDRHWWRNRTEAQSGGRPAILGPKGLAVLTPLPAVVGGRKKDKGGNRAGTRRIPSASLAVDSFNAEPSREELVEERPSEDADWNAQAEQWLIDSRSRKPTNNSTSSSRNPSRNPSSSSRGRKRTATTSASASNPNSKRPTPVPSRASSPTAPVSVFIQQSGTFRKLVQPTRTTTTERSPERQFQVAISPPKAGITAADNALITARLEEGDNYVPGTMPSEGYRRPAWREAQDAEPYADDVLAAIEGTQEQPIVLDDSDSDQGGGEDENDGFVDIDDVIPDSPSAIAMARRTDAQPRLETQDMFPNDPGVRALIRATDSQRAALVDTQVFHEIMSTLRHGVDEGDESTESEADL